MAQYMVDEHGLTHVVKDPEIDRLYGLFVCSLCFSTEGYTGGFSDVVRAHMMGGVFPTCLECVVME